MKKSQALYFIPVVIVLFIGTIIVLFAGFDVVEANHIGVKIRFGEIRGTMSAGMQWTGLFVHVEEYDLRTRKLVVDMQGSQSSVDKTGQAVYGTIDVNFRIKPNSETILKLYQEVGSDGVIADRMNIDAIVREGFKQATSQYDAISIATDNREKVKEEAIRLIRLHFPEQYFELQNVVVTNIDFSENFKQSIEAKKIALQNKEKEQNQLEVVRFQQEQELLKYKNIAEQYKLQSQQITPLLIQKQWIEKWSGNLPSYIITTPDQANFLMQLPTGIGTNQDENNNPK